MEFSRQAFPRVRNMLGYFHPGCEADCLDPDGYAEAATFWWPDEAWSEFVAEMDLLLLELEHRTDEEASLYVGLQVALPAGRTWVGWLHYLRSYLEDFYPHRKPQTQVTDGAALPRASRFDEKETGNAAATEVLRVNESTLRAWAADPDEPWRLHLYADLGRRVGDYLLADEVAAYRRAGSDPALRPPAHEATGCVVLMRRDAQTKQPYIATAHPEKALPIEARQRYPDLPLLFGGYFGQDYTALDENRWAAERNFNYSTVPATRERISDQLAQLLLTTDDDVLRSQVEALGSYVLPVAIRSWVTGLHRRMTRLEWR
jgi:hypothetical protein